MIDDGVFAERIRALAVELAEHNAREAKAKADLAELTLEHARRASAALLAPNATPNARGGVS